MIKNYKNFIENFPDFPKSGINFKDISSLLENPEIFTSVIKDMTSLVKPLTFNKIAAIESRGFIIGSILANKLNKGLILSRKKDKLPGKLITEKYNYEYSSSELSIQEKRLKTNDKILIVDDVLATGNTALSVFNIINKKTKSAGFIFLIELTFLNGREFLLKNTNLNDNQIISLIKY